MTVIRGQISMRNTFSKEFSTTLNQLELTSFQMLRLTSKGLEFLIFSENFVSHSTNYQHAHHFGVYMSQIQTRRSSQSASLQKRQKKIMLKVVSKGHRQKLNITSKRKNPSTKSTSKLIIDRLPRHIFIFIFDTEILLIRC